MPITQISIAIPSSYLPIEELAKHREVPLEKLKQIGVSKLSIPYRESVITLALRAISKLRYQDVAKFYFATESNPDLSKSVSSILLPRLGLHHVESAEYQFACISGIEAWLDAERFARAEIEPAILCCFDRSIYPEDFPSAECTQGCAAIAMRIEPGKDRAILEPKPPAGIYVDDIDDFKVPYRSFPFPEFDGELSMISYLHCMKQAYEHWKYIHRGINPLEYHDFLVFHVPFTMMIKYASAALYKHEFLSEEIHIEDCMKDRSKFGEYRESLRKVRQIPEFEQFFNSKIAPGLKYHPEIGNCYTASVFLGLISVLEQVIPGQRIGIGGYGSGAKAMVISAIAHNPIKTDLELQLKSRKPLSWDQYLEWRRQARLNQNLF